MSTVHEIEAVIPQLPRREVEQLRSWLDEYLEDQMELANDVTVRLDESRADIASGNFTERKLN